MFMEDKVRRQLDIFLDSIALGISFSKSFLWLNSLQNIPQADELDSAEIWGRKYIWKCLPLPFFSRLSPASSPLLLSVPLPIHSSFLDGTPQFLIYSFSFLLCLSQ